MKWETPKERLKNFDDLDKQKLIERFEKWKGSLGALSNELLAYVPSAVAARLDFSVASLLPLEAWLLQTFDDHHQLLADQDGRTMELLHAYLAQTLVPAAKGHLDICLDESDICFSVPVVVFPRSFSERHMRLLNYPTAAVHRRQGSMLYDLARKWEELAAKDSTRRSPEDLGPIPDKFDVMLDAAVAEEEAKLDKK